jgi:hypothetical protein
MEGRGRLLGLYLGVVGGSTGLVTSGVDDSVVAVVVGVDGRSGFVVNVKVGA